MDRKHLTETVIRRDADTEPPRMGSRRVSARCFRFMPIVNNDFKRLHWHRDMNCVLPPKTRRRPIHGGSNPASDHYGWWKCRFCRSKNLPCGIGSLAATHNPCLSYLRDCNALNHPFYYEIFDIYHGNKPTKPVTNLVIDYLAKNIY